MNCMKSSILFVVLSFLVSCGPNGESKQTQSQEQRIAQLRADSAALKIATVPTMDCLPLFVAVADSSFQQVGVDVRLRQCNAQIDCDTLVAGGHVEGLVTDIVRAERLRRAGTGLTYVAATNANWQLVSNRTARVKSVAQLSEKMIAVTRYSATSYLADLAIKEANVFARAPSHHGSPVEESCGDGCHGQRHSLGSHRLLHEGHGEHSAQRAA